MERSGQARGLQSKNFLLWFGLINAFALRWKQILRTGTTSPVSSFDPTNYTLFLKSNNLTIFETNTKNFYDELVSSLQETPTPQARFNEMYPGRELS